MPVFRQHAMDSGVADVDALVAQLQAVVPTSVSDVSNELRMFSTQTGGFESVESGSVMDIPRLRPSITQTYEIGYKAVVANKLIVNGGCVS